MNVNTEDIPPADLSRAHIPKAVRVQVRQRDGEQVVCMEILSHHKDATPENLSDCTSTVYAFDAAMLIMFTDFLLDAGFNTFGPAPFLANLAGQLETAAHKAGHKSDGRALLDALIRELPCDDTDCEIHGAKAEEAKPDNNQPSGMYL